MADMDQHGTGLRTALRLFGWAIILAAALAAAIAVHGAINAHGDLATALRLLGVGATAARGTAADVLTLHLALIALSWLVTTGLGVALLGIAAALERLAALHRAQSDTAWIVSGLRQRAQDQDLRRDLRQARDSGGPVWIDRS